MNRRVVAWLAGTWLFAAPVALAQDMSVNRPLNPAVCTFEGMVDDVRGALRTGSPAFKRYVRERLKESVLALPPEVLQAAVERERDPEVLEVLSAALSAQVSRMEKPEVLQPLLTRATKDADPAARAAAVRGMRGIGSVDAMAKSGSRVTYEQLIRDPAPEVRQAVVENLVHENAKVYFGHDQGVSEAAISAALASRDPEATARLLREVSTEQVGPEAVRRLSEPLRSESPAVRAAAATALGGVPAASTPGARASLVEAYRTDKDPAVRKAALEGIARLGQSGARPLLESLRGVDPAMDPEIDAWLSAMKLNLQEWHLLLREKQRRRK